ncbi:DUF6090 family protein [Psychroserpens burtonensis]|uniref:DUF6090 family protein n=1 Tax=Psychroserpens burtonensis TaxID=49278 RepID=UPI0004046161|nr:DUF6090 family protein [Psychroserpens burtonensis]
MIKLFRNIRKNLLNEGKTTKYFKYAIGEIILVVIGILIALQINNWNEERKDAIKLINVYALINNDIKNDIGDLQRSVDFYMEKKPVFEKVVNDSITPDLLDKGLSRLLFDGPAMILNKKGVSQLRELQVNDTLTFYLNDIYEWMDTKMLPLENSISAEFIDHQKYVRDNYKWYAEWMENTITQDLGSKELHNYFLTNHTYRNRVIFIYNRIEEYTRMLKALIKGLTEFQDEIDEILKESE